MEYEDYMAPGGSETERKLRETRQAARLELNRQPGDIASGGAFLDPDLSERDLDYEVKWDREKELDTT